MTENFTVFKNKVNRIAADFVQENYPKESTFFVAFWESFETNMNKWQAVAPENWPIAEGTQKVATELGFSDFKSMDLVTPVVLCTVAKVLSKTTSESLSISDLETVVGKVAASCGASGQLLAQLMHHLPQLCVAVQTAKSGVKQAFVSIAKKTQYEIWADGEPPRIVHDIKKYKAKENEYLFWIDLTNGEFKSLGEKKGLKPTAMKLLLFLVENIGVSLKFRKVYKEVIGIDPEGVENWRNLLHQYIRQLHKFAEESFRESHLFHDLVYDTLCLKASFRDKYFVFRTLRSP
jgi:hypothetical protein